MASEQAAYPIEVRFALRLANVGYFLTFCLGIAFAPIGYFVFKSPDFTILSTAFGVAYLLCYMAAEGGLGSHVRLIFSLIAALHYATVLLWVGPNAGLQAYIGCMLATPMIIFARTEPRSLATSLTIFCVGVVAGEYLSRIRPPILELDPATIQIAYASNMLAAGLFIAFLLFSYSRSSIKNYLKLQGERQKSEEMLFELVPAVIAERMIRGEPIGAQSHGECSVLFADMVGFTKLAAELSPVHLVEVLNSIFSDIDLLCEKHGIEKIKTIGDCYMAATGVFDDQNRPADLAKVALGVIDVVQSSAASIGHPLSVRIGISTGQVISGVIGRKRPLFDIWGQTVNMARLMEANSLANTVLVAETTLWRLKNQFEFEPFHPVRTKNGDKINAFQLLAAKPVSQDG